MWHGISTGLMISSFIFIACVILFFFGCNFVFRGTDEVLWMWISIVCVVGMIPSLTFLIKCKTEINLYIDYGKDVYLAAGYIKKIIKEVNIYGVENLKEIVEKAMKKEIDKIAKNELQGNKK